MDLGEEAACQTTEAGGSCSCCREVGRGRSRGVRRRGGRFWEASAVMEGFLGLREGSTDAGRWMIPVIAQKVAIGRCTRGYDGGAD
jgi:hypothetical protein